MITIANDRVAMKHGAGGRAMRRLIEEVFLPGAGAVAAAMDDGAVLPIAAARPSSSRPTRTSFSRSCSRGATSVASPSRARSTIWR